MAEKVPVSGENYMNEIARAVYRVAEQLVVGQLLDAEKVQRLTERVADLCTKELEIILPNFKIMVTVILAERGDCGLVTTNCNMWELGKDYMHHFNFDAQNYKCFITAWTIPC